MSSAIIRVLKPHSVQRKQRGGAYNFRHNLLFFVRIAIKFLQADVIPACNAIVKYLLFMSLYLFIIFIFDPFLHRYSFWQRFFSSFLIYRIDSFLISEATIVIFTTSKRTKEKICLRIWKRFRNDFCDTKNRIMIIEYIREGLEFNRKFAPGVYLGIACIKRPKQSWNRVELWGKVRRGKLIRNPKWDELTDEVKQGKLPLNFEYAFVMRCLPESWCLVKQLQSKKLASDSAMQFLAEQIALMHKELRSAEQHMGTAQSIEAKLNLNLALLQTILSSLSCTDEEKSNYRLLFHIMKDAFVDCKQVIGERHTRGCIKRCHGDLKATNLWIRPMLTWRWFIGSKPFGKQLLALDCIDFNAGFCNIDTLSDVAMLAIDIEMHLVNYAQVANALHLTENFLATYLKKAGEDSEKVRLLLEYYLTEKAIVCTCVSVLYEKNAETAKQYLDVALTHAKRLATYSTSSKYEVVTQATSF